MNKFEKWQPIIGVIIFVILIFALIRWPNANALESPQQTASIQLPHPEPLELDLTAIDESMIVYPVIDIPEPEFCSEEELIMIAKTIKAEIGDGTDIEKSAIAWTIFNRVDAGTAGGFGDTVTEVCLQPNQVAYRKWTELRQCDLDIAKDVYERWKLEKEGEGDYGRVLPPDYFWYSGDGKHNYFRNDYLNEDKLYWDWSLPNPYTEEN